MAFYYRPYFLGLFGNADEAAFAADPAEEAAPGTSRAHATGYAPPETQGTRGRGVAAVLNAERSYRRTTAAFSSLAFR